MANPKVEAWREAKNCIRSDRGVISEMEVAGDALAAEVVRLEGELAEGTRLLHDNWCDSGNECYPECQEHARESWRDALKAIHSRIASQARKAALMEAADKLKAHAEFATAHGKTEAALWTSECEHIVRKMVDR